MRRLICFQSVILIVCLGCGSKDADLRRLESAREALAKGNLVEAEQFAAAISPTHFSWAEGRFILASVAQRSGNWQQALEYYRVIPRDSPLYAAALGEAAAVEQAHGNLHAAIRDFNALLEVRPDDVTARRTLANLLASTGQRRLADAHLWILIKAKVFEFKQLVMFTDFDRRDPNDAKFLEWCEQRAPHDAAVQTGLAVEAISQGDLPAARRRLELAISIDPLISAAQGLLGELLVEGDAVEFNSWYRRVPPAIRDDPEIWQVRALWAQRQERPEIAAHCFWHAAHGMPASYRIVYRFGIAAVRANGQEGEAILEHAQSLFDLRQSLSQFLNSRTPDREALRRVVELLVAAGRDWEARCWALHARERLKPVPWADATLSRLPGGVAVIDFDGDDRPDLFFTQGHDWPLNSDLPAPSESYQDRLFRNLGAGFQDVSQSAGLVFEAGFGQGCAAGDFDNDGFPDLYVANIGKNQLLINQGDGTFKDVTDALQLAASAWTSSCLIADLNNDGNPDLFDVNYLEGPSLYRRICNETECTPESYKPAPDQLYLSQGDGTVKAVDLQVDRRWGSGLGIIAFDIDRHPLMTGEVRRSDLRPPPARLSLFIANDHEPNFLLINRPSEGPDWLSLTEEAFLRGVAVNQDGRPTASMGVACGDANGDGLLDLFVTNYKNEASNLYLQSTDGLFEDAISGSGLLIPGLPYVKWGTQFLDADNDGHLDLAIANGHVGDFHIPGIECYMPTQFFRNDGRGRFHELKASAIGEFFDRKLLGRTLARCDWNGDGLTDLIAVPIASPAAILTNRSQSAGNSLVLRLHATSTARDAIGAAATITTATGKFHQQLTAGDGYQASNERVLRFGLAGQTQVAQVVIDWPGGTTRVLEHLPANTLWDVVEGGRVTLVRSWPNSDDTAD
jgi:tetratricopeptide (TPR) repeat protein